MKNSYSNIFSFNKKILRKTVKTLSNGDLVGLPTETVYGLGGDAYSKVSVRKIFKLKRRPKLTPKIYKDIRRKINGMPILKIETPNKGIAKRAAGIKPIKVLKIARSNDELE